MTTSVPNYQQSPPRWTNAYPANTDPPNQPTYTLVFNAQPYYNTLPHYNPHRANIHLKSPWPYAPVQTTTHHNRPAYAPKLRPNFEARNPRNFTPIAEPLAQLFDRMRRAGLIYPVEGRIPDQSTKHFDASNAPPQARHRGLLWFKEWDLKCWLRVEVSNAPQLHRM